MGGITVNKMKTIIKLFILSFFIFNLNNAYAQEVLTKVEGGASWLGFIGASVDLTNHATLGVATSKIEFDHETSDANDIYNNNTGNYFFEAPRTGYYRLEYSLGIIFDGVSTTSPGTQVFMSVVKDPFSGGANAVVARNAVSCSELNSTFPIHYINGTHILHAFEGDRFWLEANRTGLTGTVQVANSTFSHFAFSAL